MIASSAEPRSSATAASATVLRNASVRAIALTRFRAFRCLSALLNAPADSVGQRDLNWRGVAWRGVAWRVACRDGRAGSDCVTSATAKAARLSHVSPPTPVANATPLAPHAHDVCTHPRMHSKRRAACLHVHKLAPVQTHAHLHSLRRTVGGIKPMLSSTSGESERAWLPSKRGSHAWGSLLCWYPRHVRPGPAWSEWHRCGYTCMHTCIPAYLHTYVRLHTQTHTNTQIHRHMPGSLRLRGN